MEFPELALQWLRGDSVAHCDGPTQSFGNNFDWFLIAPWVRLSDLRHSMAVGSDHRLVWAKVPSGAGTLGPWTTWPLSDWTGERGKPPLRRRSPPRCEAIGLGKRKPCYPWC